MDGDDLEAGQDVEDSVFNGTCEVLPWFTPHQNMQEYQSTKQSKAVCGAATTRLKKEGC
jgi:hypothetical protein